MDTTQRSDGTPPDAVSDAPAAAGDPLADLLLHVGQLRARLAAHLSLLVECGRATLTSVLLHGAVIALIVAGFGGMMLIGMWFLIVGTAGGLERLIGDAWPAQL